MSDGEVAIVEGKLELEVLQQKHLIFWVGNGEIANADGQIELIQQKRLTFWVGNGEVAIADRKVKVLQPGRLISLWGLSLDIIR